MNTTILVAIIVALTTIITANITDFLNKRSSLKFEKQKLKEQYYLEFIHALSENMISFKSCGGHSSSVLLLLRINFFSCWLKVGVCL